MAQQEDWTKLLQPPPTAHGMTFDVGPEQRLAFAMRSARTDDPTFIPDTGRWSNANYGVPNPYGRGLAAYEPNSVIFDGLNQASQDAAAAKAQAAAEAPGTLNVPAPGATLGKADGQVGTAVAAAMALAQKRTPYVWGGTSASGLDCSGLIYYAFQQAGIKIPRYRAVDYGSLGQSVTAAQARPGDIVYYNEPGDTDHVGIYVGNHQMVQAPQSGDVVKVSDIGTPTSIRRLYDDNGWASTATPGGATGTLYNGLPWWGDSITPMGGVQGSTVPSPTTQVRGQAHAAF